MVKAKKATRKLKPILVEKPTRVTRKFTKAERKEHDRIAALAEEEFPPKPVSAARIAMAQLRNARQLADVSLTELSKRTGMAKANLSRLENHCENVNVATLEKYAAAVDCKIVIAVQADREKYDTEWIGVIHVDGGKAAKARIVGITADQAKEAVKKKPVKKKRVAKR